MSKEPDMFTTIVMWIIIIGVSVVLVSLFAGVVSGIVDMFKDR